MEQEGKKSCDATGSPAVVEFIVSIGRPDELAVASSLVDPADQEATSDANPLCSQLAKVCPDM